MNKENIVVHIGLHRTGTTYLQREFFPKLNGVNFINIQDNTRISPTDLLSIELAQDKINLISYEGLSGHPHFVDRKGYGCKDRILIAKSLKKLYPDAKIILCIRTNAEWYTSLHSQFMKMKPISDPVYFMEHFDKGYFNQDEYIDLLKSLFSEIFIYKYETFKSDFDTIIDGLCSFIGVDKPIGLENKVINKSANSGKQRLLSVLYRCILKGYGMLK